jgi:DNA/RNA endonuclease YhcR with UshA esterase domain
LADCPSCGRYVGPHDACPYCGVAFSGRTSLRQIRIAVLLLAVGGLALLWLAATYTEVPTITIDQASALTNWARVRVQGQVSRPPAYDGATEYLSFWLADETGELHVAVYEDETRSLIRAERFPEMGDRATVQGVLRVREDFVSLTLDGPESLELVREPAVARSIGEITEADQYRRVQVTGQVRRIRSPYPGLTLISLRDSSGEIELVVAEPLATVCASPPPFTTGQTVEVIAPISLYRGTPQLSLGCGSQLAVAAPRQPFAAERTINQIGAGQLEEWVTVRGTMGRPTPFSGGVKHQLDDGTGTITLLLWQDLYDTLAAQERLEVGGSVVVVGRISEYGGELEIVPELPMDVQMTAGALAVAPATPAPQPTQYPTSDAGSTLTPGAPATPTPTPGSRDVAEKIPIGELSAGRMGEMVTVNGRVVGVDSIPQGFKFTLDDGTGRAVLLLWEAVYDECPVAPALNVGASVQATGELSLYEGELQVEPADGADLQVRGAAPRSGDPTAIEALGSLLGERVIVKGQVAHIQENSEGRTLFVQDETGTLAVFIWDNILERIPQREALNKPGARVQIAGTLQEYRGELELLPALPYDVVVIE